MHRKLWVWVCDNDQKEIVNVIKLIKFISKLSYVRPLLYKIKSEIFVHIRPLGLYEGSIDLSCDKYIACGPAACRALVTDYASLLTRLFRYWPIKGTFYFRLHFSWQHGYCSKIIKLYVKSWHPEYSDR